MSITGEDILKNLTGQLIGNIEEKTSKSIKYIKFERDLYLTFGEGDHQLEYSSQSDKGKKLMRVKYGQFKLFLAELQFFNLYFDPKIHKKAVCVYIGAALGTHIAPLAKMYPMIEFKLYDPQPFNTEVLSPVDNIEMINELFTDVHTKYWANQQKEGTNVFLIVDIRNTAYKKIPNVHAYQKAFRDNEKLVTDDMNLQRYWFEQIKPTKALLKMRLPYYENFLTTPETLLEYLDGIVYRQQFAPPTSTETRLVPYDADDTGKYPTRIWNIISYERVTNSHNKGLREGILIKESKGSEIIKKEFIRFINPFSAQDKSIKFDQPIAETLGLINDYDSTAATLIILDYLLKFGVNADYTNFYNFAKVILDDVGKSNMWNYNLAGIRQGDKYANEEGEIIEQEQKAKRGTEDPENDPTSRE